MCGCLRSEVWGAGRGTDDPKGLSHGVGNEGEAGVEVLRVVHREEPREKVVVEDLDILLFQTAPASSSNQTLTICRSLLLTLFGSIYQNV